MNLPLLFARRYLLATRSSTGRSTNAINIITGISITVIAVVTAAMVVVLSTLNGISDLVDSIYSPFDQDITITAATGKTFERNAVDLDRILARQEVKATSWVIEENVLLRSGDQRMVATMKGVEPSYLGMSRMEKYMYSGEPSFEGVNGPAALLGLGLKMELGVPLDDGVFQALEISAPVRGRKLSKYQQRAFETVPVAVRGAFTMNLDFDMIHVVPPQKAPDFIRVSPLADAAGWVDVDPATLRHRGFDNVFALGDAGNTTNAKTAAAARKQAPVVAHNLLVTRGEARGDARYDGYGSCPLTVERGKIVLAEFTYGGKLAPSFPGWLIDGTRPSRLAWYLKERILPPLYWEAMLKGREWMAKPEMVG